jgi:dienelactone hydrolase
MPDSIVGLHHVTAITSNIGFSQGACLATEYVARHPRHYGAVVAFTGGLIGRPDAELHHHGKLTGTTVLLSSGDPDPHAPWPRVEATAKELTAMGATVQLIRYHVVKLSVLRGEFLIDECLSLDLVAVAHGRRFVESSHVVWMGKAGWKD